MSLVHQNAELDTVQSVTDADIIFSSSTYGNATVDDGVKIASGLPKLFQLYMSKDDNFNRCILVKGVQSPKDVLTHIILNNRYKSLTKLVGFFFANPRDIQHIV